MKKLSGLTMILLWLVFSTSAIAATYTVTKIADTNDGTCDADCSLREAVAAAGATADNDTIVFDAMVFSTPQTITLSGSEIILGANGTVDINGPGASLLTISGNNASRIIVTGSGVVATISGAKFTMGNGVGATNTGRGGAIYNVSGNLTLNNVIVTGNSAANGGGLNNAAATGGSGANLTLNNCILSNNTSTSSGGGMQNFSTSTVTINNSTFMGNTSGGSTGGGGAQLNGGVRITNSTFANNNAPGGAGGGIQSNGTLGAVLTNVTISGNTSTNNGGGIHRGTTNVNFFIRNSIVANNNGAAASPDVTNSAGGIVSEGTNLIGSVGTSTGWLMSDLLNTSPMLGMLGDNGGSTPTFMPMNGSPVINGGQNCVVDLSCATNNPPVAVTTDQRGVFRPLGAAVDIGSVEVVVNASVSGRVTSDGSPVSRALVTLTPAMTANGLPVVYSAITNSFGQFTVAGVPTGQTYTLNVSAKQYVICPQNILVNNDVSGLMIVTQGPNVGGLRSNPFKSNAVGCAASK